MFLELFSLGMALLAGVLHGTSEDCDYSNRYDHQCDLFTWVERGQEETVNLVEYIPGDTNIIFSVPHDGFLKLRSVPDRRPGCKPIGGSKKDCVYPGSADCPEERQCFVVTYVDRNTRKMAKLAWDTFRNVTGTKPYMVINNLHRSQLDPNREIQQAAEGDQKAEKAYNEFHGKIELAKSLMGGPGLLIDFHGQTHKQNSTELGYLYLTEELNSDMLDTRQPSISSLQARTGLDMRDLLAGPLSLGAELEWEGVRAVPSPRQPRPGQDKYFRGGWITQEHGSRDGGEVDAIQMEFPSELRYDAGEEGWRDLAVRVGRVISRFHGQFYVE